MSQEHLQALIADVDRLITAGASLAAGDDGLRKRDKELRDLGKKVPALVPVAGRVRKVLDAKDSEAPRALLDLLLATRQLRASLAGAGVVGTLEPVPASGPWETKTLVSDFDALSQALTGSGSGRLEVVKDALARGAVNDLRLIGSLVEALNDGNGELADLIATEVLPKFGPSIVSDLQSTLNYDGKKGDGRRLLAICRAAPEVGVTLCRAVLQQGNAVMRVSALTCLPEVAPKEETIRAALDVLSGKTPKELKSAAIKALRAVKPAEEIPTLIKLLNHVNAKFQENAYKALGKIGKPAVGPLIEVLRSAQENAPLNALLALQEMGSAADSAVPALIEMLTGKDSERTLGTIGKTDKHTDILVEAVRTFGTIGKDAVEAIALLYSALKDARLEVRAAAACALFKIAGDTKKTLPVLVEAVQSKSTPIGKPAAEILLQMGYAAESAIPELVQSLCTDYHGCGYVQTPIADLLIVLGKRSGSIAKALLKVLDERNWGLYILREIGSNAKPVIP